MQRKSLVRLWVAEGFVENIGLGALEEFFFLKRKVLLILDNYIKMIQLYKIHPGLCITKIHTAYEKKTKKRENVMT